jgi:F0F1-type ATP synthase delta subunit
MRYSQSVCAKQYAKAYLNEFGQNLTWQDIGHMKSAIHFFRRHHNFLSLINELMYDEKSSKVVLKEFFHHFSLPESLHALIKVLINHVKLMLFCQVLQDICCLYAIRNDILEVTVFSATPMQPAELEPFKDFFEKLAQKKIITTLVHDPSLIAGIRMQSDLFLWQYSIAARIKKLRQNMLIKG